MVKMIIAFSPPAPEKLHYLHCFPHTRLTLTAAGRSIFEQPSQSGVHDKYPPPRPHLAPTFIFSARLLMGEGLIQASQLRSRPRKRLAPLRRLAAVDPPTLVGGKDRRGVRVCACTRVSVETVWNSLLHASVSSALPFSLFIVRARGEGRGLQDKRQKGFLMLHSCPMTGWRSRCAA